MKHFLCIIIVMVCQSLTGQNVFFLQSKSNKNETLQIKENTRVTIEATSAKIKNCDLVFVNDSLLIIKKIFFKPGRSIDSIIQLNYQDVLAIRKPLLKNGHWIEPFAWVFAGAGLGLLITPLIWADTGKGDALEFLKDDVITLGVCGIPLLIGESTRRFDLKTKWNLLQKYY